MRNIRWQLLIAIGGLALVVVLLIGQTPDQVTAPAQPVTGGVHSEALIGEIIRLNPILDFSNQPDRDIDRLIYHGLLHFDSRGIPVPDLAAAWSISADATLYTFTLREDAVWHDGEPITSDDIVYTYSKLQDDNYPGPEDIHELWNQVNIIQLDDRRVQFQLPEPFAPFLDYLSVGLLPDHLLRGVSAGDLIDHPFNLDPIGTGPFRLDQFILEENRITGVSLVAFDEFYGQQPFLERIELILFENEQDALKAYNNGEVKGIGYLGESILSEGLSLPSMNVHSARLPRLGLIFLNLQNPEKDFLSEKTVRRALAIAINRQWIIDQVFLGQAVQSIGPIMPGTWAFAEGIKALPFDPDEAAQILESEGWELPAGASPGTPEYQRVKDEEILSLELVHLEDDTNTQIAELVKQYWEAIAIQVELVPVSSDSLLNDFLQPRDYQAALTELDLGSYPDPDPYSLWHDSQTETGQNYSGFSDRNISIWLEQARTTPDRGRRSDLYTSFQYRFQDQVPSILMYYPIYNYGIDAQVQGVTVGPLFNPSDRFNTVFDWYLVARRGVSPEKEETSQP
ncbi:MAG: peptide ABC transporter substrate-binding protein [Anaerolineales bacterium]